MKDPFCPFLSTATKKVPCEGHACMLYTRLTQLADPQTGVSRDDYGCAFAWLPILLVENSNQTRQASAAVNSMRNEVVQRQDTLNAAIAIASQGRPGVRREKDIGDFGSRNDALPGLGPSVDED